MVSAFTIRDNASLKVYSSPRVHQMSLDHAVIDLSPSMNRSMCISSTQTRHPQNRSHPVEQVLMSELGRNSLRYNSLR